MNSADSNIQKQHLFGRWRFNADTGDLYDGETTTRLEPQVAKLLDYFLSHQNRLTSRDELIAAVWDERIVSDDAVNRCISILRHMLSPDDQNAYIETVVRRGYISHFPASPAEKPHTVQSPRRRNYLILAAFVSLTAIIFYSAVERFTYTPAEVQVEQREGLPMVAVLPFTSSGFAGDSEFFANGIHDDLLTQLAQLQSIRVISRTSVLEYQDSNRNIREIGQELGADAILEGGIQRIGNKIRINAQLIDTHSDTHLWAGQYDRELQPANIFDVQTDITRAIASALQATLTEQDTAQLSVLPTENMAAYRAYHRAMEIRGSKQMGDPTYIAVLEEAVNLDPKFVRAWAEIVGTLSLENFSLQNPESIQRIEQILENIRTLAPKSADYLIAQAFYTYYILRDYDQAYQLVTRAQKLRPSDELVVELKSWIERRLGDFEAMTESRRLSQKLDPRNPRWTIGLVRILMMTHHYDEASQEIENSPFQKFELSVLNSILQLREHQDPGRWLAALTALQEEFENVSNPLDLWDAHIAKRDYAAAEKLFSGVSAVRQFSGHWTTAERWGVDIYSIINYWFLQASDRLDPLLIQGRLKLDERRDSDDDFLIDMEYLLIMAFLSAAEGNTQETEHLIRAWQRAATEDLATLANLRHYSCRALGMAAATTAAVQCIRTGLVEPSLVMPFMEPYLPYYDLIRDEPEFVGLLADIQGKAVGME